MREDCRHITSPTKEADTIGDLIQVRVALEMAAGRTVAEHEQVNVVAHTANLVQCPEQLDDVLVGSEMTGGCQRASTGRQAERREQLFAPWRAGGLASPVVGVNARRDIFDRVVEKPNRPES